LPSKPSADIFVVSLYKLTRRSGVIHTTILYPTFDQIATYSIARAIGFYLAINHDQ
jgi:hypothetical protein